MRDRKIRFVSPERDGQIARRAVRGSRGGRPSAFKAERSKQRNVIKRCLNRRKPFRNLAACSAKRAAYDHAELTIATFILWLR